MTAVPPVIVERAVVVDPVPAGTVARPSSTLNVAMESLKPFRSNFAPLATKTDEPAGTLLFAPSCKVPPLTVLAPV